ncbi:hypothetical protein ACEPAG_8991 [Sanghuangporus baumii]
MSTHYSLRVIGATSWVLDHLIHEPDLYVELKIGSEPFRTKTIKGNVAPQWNESFRISTATEILFDISLNCESTKSGSMCIGTCSTSLGSLLDTWRGEAMLKVRSYANQQVTGVVSICLEFARSQEKGDDDIRQAKEAIDRLTFQNSSFANCIPAAAEIASDILGTTEILSESLEEMIKNILPKVGRQSRSDNDGLDRGDGQKKPVAKTAVTTFILFHPVFFLTAKAAASLLKSMSNQIQVDRHVIDLVHLVGEIVDFFKHVDVIIPEKNIYLQSKITEFLQEIADLCNFVAGYSDQSFTKRVFSCGLGRKVDIFRMRFNELRNSLRQGVDLQTNFGNERRNSRDDITFLRNELKPAEMDASVRPICLVGTRTEILKKVYSWFFSATTEKAAAENILWLSGPAGCGKSAISMSISERCLSIGQRGAYLFFERDDSHPNSVIRTIAFWLACFDKTIRDNILKAVESNNGIASSSLHAQFKKLLLEPLRAAEGSIRGPVVIIIDGLDKLAPGYIRDDLLSLIREEFPKVPSTFRFLITSRLDPGLLLGLTHSLTSHSIHHISLSEFQTVTHDDISRYINHEMRSIVVMNNLQDWWEHGAPGQSS